MCKIYTTSYVKWHYVQLKRKIFSVMCVESFILVQQYRKNHQIDVKFAYILPFMKVISVVYYNIIFVPNFYNRISAVNAYGCDPQATLCTLIIHINHSKHSYLFIVRNYLFIHSHFTNYNTLKKQQFCCAYLALLFGFFNFVSL